MARRELREEHEDRGRNPPPPLPIRYSSLPTLGILVTAMLLLPIAWSLLSNLNLRPETAEALKIRVFPSKQGEDKKAGAKQRDQSPREVGTVWQSLAEYQKRLGYLDVRGKQQAFLSIWAVTNLFQAALTVVVFAVSIKTLLLFTPRNDWKLALGLPTAILVITVVSVFLIHFLGVINLKLDGSLLSYLQDEVEQRSELRKRVSIMTTIGNISIAIITVVTPIAVGVLLPGGGEKLKERIGRFHVLMYWTACLLVVGVIQVTYQSRWPSLFFDDDTSIQCVGQMAAGAGLLVGGVFTIASGLVFLPAGFLLYRGYAPADGSADAPSKNNDSWLKEILSILAPVATALPIAKLFDLIF